MGTSLISWSRNFKLAQLPRKESLQYALEQQALVEIEILAMLNGLANRNCKPPRRLPGGRRSLGESLRYGVK